MITSNSHLSSIYSRYRGVQYSLRWVHGCPASFTFRTRHSLIPVKHTIHASHFNFFFVCIPIPLRLSIDLGRLVGSMPLRYRKSISHTYPASSQTASSCAVDIVVLVFYRFALRIALYSYIYCLFGRLSIELYSRYMIMIMINRYTPC